MGKNKPSFRPTTLGYNRSNLVVGPNAYQLTYQKLIVSLKNIIFLYTINA